ncbi:MAG: hypothetical protein WKF30_09035 [Pyrinomonadaceae bacterium]
MLKRAKLRFAVAIFCKLISCPPSETLFAYRSGQASQAMRERLSSHLAECEFCGAELQLLDSCPPEVEERQACQIPPHLKILYEETIGAPRTDPGSA